MPGMPFPCDLGGCRFDSNLILTLPGSCAFQPGLAPSQGMIVFLGLLVGADPGDQEISSTQGLSDLARQHCFCSDSYDSSFSLHLAGVKEVSNTGYALQITETPGIP